MMPWCVLRCWPMRWTCSRLWSIRLVRLSTAAQMKNTGKDLRWRLRLKDCCLLPVRDAFLFALHGWISELFPIFWSNHFFCLASAERRVALKAELDRLKAEGPTAQMKSTSGAQVDMGIPASKGSISLLELRLPLKADFICSSANKPGRKVSAFIYSYFVLHLHAQSDTHSCHHFDARLWKPLLLCDDPCWSREHSGDSSSKHTHWSKWRCFDLLHQIHFVSVLSYQTTLDICHLSVVFFILFSVMCRSDVSNDFEIDIEVYCFVSTAFPCTFKWNACLNTN